MMRKLTLKKTQTWIVLVVFLFTTFVSMTGLTLPTNAANDLKLINVATNPSTVTPGTFFDLALNFENNSADTITVNSIDFSGNSNISIGKGLDYAINETISGNDTEAFEIKSMKYFGSSSLLNLSFTVKYTISGVPGTYENTIVIPVEQPKTDPNPQQPDTSKYKPTFQVDLSSYNVVEAGKSNTIQLSIKNTSSLYEARNIVYVPVYDKDSPFVSSKAVSSMPISRLDKSSTTNASISVEVDKFAAEGTYPFTFKLSYTNPWNTEYPAETFTIYLKITNPQTNANLEINFKDGKSVSAAAGSTFAVPLSIWNRGSFTAKNVKVTLTGLSQDTFTLSSGTGRYDFTRIYGNEAYDMNFTVRASSSLKSGSYPLTFSIEYTDEKGNKVTDEQQVWIPVAGNEDKVSQIELVEITPSQTNVKPGDSFSVTVKVKNSGDFEARQIKVSADGTTALMPVSQNLQIISSLKKDETKTLVFRFQPQPDAARGSVPITIKVESVEAGNNTSIAQAISVFIDSTNDGGKPEAGKNVPKIIVKSYASTPTLVQAGDKFTLDLTFLNTHASKTIRNIKGNFIVTESSNETGNVFSPVDCSNTFYIDEIGPKGTYDWSLTLYTIPDAKSKTYTVTISFEYEDTEGNPYKADELIGIPVYQPSRFETSEIYVPSESMMGQPNYVGFEMYNMGKTTIYNVRLTIEADEGSFNAEPKSNYFGNFESGYREYFEFMLTPMMPGQAKGRIIFQYETASGEQQEMIKEISMNVMEMPVFDDMPVDGFPMDPGVDQAPKGFFQSVWFYIILGVVVVGVVVLVIVLVKRKRKKDKEFEF